MRASSIGPTSGVGRSARSDLVATLVVGAISAVVVIVALVFRLVEIFSGHGVAVPVQFAPVQALVPGPTSGATVTVDTGWVVVADLPAAALVSVVLSALLPALAALVVIGCGVIVVDRLLRGDAFAPGTARLVTISSWAVLLGWVATIAFGTMASNGALAVASDGEHSGVAIHVSWLPFLAAMALGALAILLRSAEKMRSDTDGLV